MRQSDIQFSLVRPPIQHPHAAELEQISQILDANPRMAQLVAQDLVRGVRHPGTGARGLSGDQVLRILILKQMTGLTYRELTFHLADSVSYRAFCRLGEFDRTPGRTTLAENVKKVSKRTLEKINRRLVRHAIGLGIEKGRRVRLDATVTEKNIHEPRDSSLLFDVVRVLVRLLGRARSEFGFDLWSDHTKRAKRRMLDIQNARGEPARVERYRNLLTVTRRTIGYGERALTHLQAVAGPGRPAAVDLAGRFQNFVELGWAVVYQTERRVLYGESVPSDEKIVSIFEPSTDIIIKDRRDTYYGHKLFLAAGASGLITDCVIAEGNPADSTMTLPLLRRQKRILGKVPEQAALDGGFASKQNLVEGKRLGIRDLAFAKKRGLKVPEMVRSSWIYQRLRDFRAGIEGLISFLKRAFGLGRCTWRGAASFGSYVMASVVSANLLTLARHLLG